MQDDAADHLDIEVAQAGGPFRRFAHDGEGFGQELEEELVLGLTDGFLLLLDFRAQRLRVLVVFRRVLRIVALARLEFLHLGT